MGEAKASERTAKLAKKRSGRAAKAAKLEHLKTIVLAPAYSALKVMGNEQLSEQLQLITISPVLPVLALAAGAASVASFLAAVLTEIYLCDVCSCQQILRRNGRG